MASKTVSGNAGELHMRIVLCLGLFQVDSVSHRPEMKVGCQRPKELMVQWKVYISQPPGLVPFGLRFVLCRDSNSRRLTNFADVTQLVEFLPSKQVVVGPSPIIRSNSSSQLRWQSNRLLIYGSRVRLSPSSRKYFECTTFVLLARQTV